MAIYEPQQIPLGGDERRAESIFVCRYSETSGYFPLPNIVCTQIDKHAGPRPSVAQFRYVFNPSILDPTVFPSRIEQVIPLNVSGPFLIGQDDRICVIKIDGDGFMTILFDGFASVPMGEISSKVEQASFEALGVETRAWDNPLGGAIIRQGPDASINNIDVTTDLPARFNPDGEPSAIPVGNYSGDGDRQYPVFYSKADDPSTLVLWTVASASRYILGVGNFEEDYVTDFQSYGILDHNLDSRSPIGVPFNPNNPATYNSNPIPCHDLDVTGEPWPIALDKLLSPHGFGFYFYLEQTAAGTPKTLISVYREDGGDGIQPVPLYLQTAGYPYDPTQTNVGSFKLSRDSSQIRNEIVLDTSPTLFEASFILVPNSEISQNDAANYKNFIEGDPNYTGENTIKFREYILSEAGDPYWDFPSGAMLTHATNLDDILGPPQGTFNDPQYVARRREPGNKLITTDSLGKNRHATLEISYDFQLPQGVTAPCPWPGGGTWWTVDGGWELMKDRVGIRLTMDDPQQLKLTKVENPSPPHGLIVNVVQSMAKPTSTTVPVPAGSANPRFYFRLTCTIEGDQGLGVTSLRTSGSTTKFTVVRRIDTRDRFVKNVVDRSSRYNPNNGNKDFIAVDNTLNAQSYADAVRGESESARFAGVVTIPRFSMAYDIGDRIQSINGRNLSLATNVGAGQGIAPKYPMVIGLTWTFEPIQTTVLQLADTRATVAPEHAK